MPTREFESIHCSAGQQLRQTIEQPDVFRNEVGFKTLGLFPGTAVQEGRWRAIDGNRYVVSSISLCSYHVPDICADSSLKLRLGLCGWHLMHSEAFRMHSEGSCGFFYHLRRSLRVLVILQQVDLRPASVRVGGGVGADDQTEAVQRRFEVLYLDESARIVRFLPDANSDSDPQLFVFEREGADALADEVHANLPQRL